MNTIIKFASISLLALFFSNNSIAQIDSNYVDEEDYSMYDDVEDVGEIVTYCSPKVFDLSPNRFISLGYDYSGKGLLKTSAVGAYGPDSTVNYNNESKINYSGVRINANIPVLSSSRFVWQVGGGFNQASFDGGDELESGTHREFVRETAKTLTSLNLNTTMFKPVGENKFLIVQLLGELNGNYGFASDSKAKPDFSNLRTSATAIFGKRPSDYLQWGIGVTRTYRSGELNYLPIVMYNYTSKNRKWGTEILFPARAAYRRKFDSRNILLIGYELEGSSYRLYDPNPLSSNNNVQNLDLRRSDIRFRFDYQKQLKGFLWLGLQAGVAVNYNFNVDTLGDTNKEIFRGFFGDQTYAMSNNLGPMPYVNVTLNIVSK